MTRTTKTRAIHEIREIASKQQTTRTNTHTHTSCCNTRGTKIRDTHSTKKWKALDVVLVHQGKLLATCQPRSNKIAAGIEGGREI
mmetsp:Transcript_20710/g.43342  ORF Transcript_20710/g.43342 Transcript_20710/m.43342 type:complete len:85 (-) Transcript_20710:982-1236(-)